MDKQFHDELSSIFNITLSSLLDTIDHEILHSKLRKHGTEARGGGGVTPIYWDTGCAIFLGYFFGWKINFCIYFAACNKFLGQFFSLEYIFGSSF